MNKIKDLSNKQINDWFVIKLTRTLGTQGAIFLCRCKCGKEQEVRGMMLRTDRSKSCKQCSYSRQSETMTQDGVPGRFWTKAKCSAERRNLEFTISKEYAYEILKKQNYKCSLTGLDIKFASVFKNNLETTASIDRLNNSLGYIEGNIQWVHKYINVMRNIFDLEYFILICRLVTENEKLKSSTISTEEYSI